MNTTTTTTTIRKRCNRYELQLVRQGSVTYDAISRSGAITSTKEAVTVVTQIVRPFVESSPCEQFIVVTLDTKHKPIGVHRVTMGTLDASLVHPREVFSRAFLDNAAAVIIVHNHPSGDLTPSREDHDVTARLTDCGKILGIPVLDHIVVGFDAETEEYRGVSLREL